MPSPFRARIVSALAAGGFALVVLLLSAPVAGAQTATTATTAAAGGTPVTVSFRCSDFTTREEAQATLQADPSQAAALDPDGNGIACDRGAPRTVTTRVVGGAVAVSGTNVGTTRVIAAVSPVTAAAPGQNIASTGSNLHGLWLAAFCISLGAVGVVLANRRETASPWDIIPRRRFLSQFRY